MLVFDIEADGLLDDLTKIHCINMVDRSTGERLRFNDQPEKAGRVPDGTLKDALERLRKADAIAGHNITNYDLPAIRKVFPDFTTDAEIHDTLVYSRLIWTDLGTHDAIALKRKRMDEGFNTGCTQNDKPVSCRGRHSLAAWGYRVGNFKDDYDGGWEEFNPEMDDYCAQDCEVTTLLLELIESKGYAQDALKLETDTARIIDMQIKHGFLFDVEAAHKLEGELTALAAELEQKTKEVFKPWFAPVRVKGKLDIVDPKRKRSAKVALEDGTVYRAYYTPGAPYCKVKQVEFEPGSRDKIADRLITLFGWEPQEFTPGGKPEVNATTLEGLDYPEAKVLKDYLVVAKTLSFLSTGKGSLLNHVGPDGRIHGKVNSNGAVTGRMTHSSPNVNFPKVKKDRDGNVLMGVEGGFGWELRSLVIVPPKKKLVGVDAEGLELRMLGHYLARYDGGAFAKSVVEGKSSEGTDSHTLNQKNLEIDTRDGAKRSMYAYLYGSGNWKLGWIFFDDMYQVNKDAFNAKYAEGPARADALSKLGARSRTRMETGIKGLGDLQETVKSKVRQGFLRSLDGRKLKLRSAHAALNTLLQGGGAVVMKKALVIAYEDFLAKGWKHGREFAFVLNVHDEFQIEADENIAEEVGAIAKEAIRKAGEAFNLRCPLAGSSDIGSSWAETH